MSGLVTGIVLDRYPGKGGERLVAVALADNAHRDGTKIFPSVQEIADRTRLSRRTVQVHLAAMVASGWLILVHKSSGRRGDTNEYRICAEWLAGGACTPPEKPVLRTNAKKLAWGAETAPHGSPAWGAVSGMVGCSLTQGGVQPAAPKPSGTVIEPPPNPPLGGAPGDDRQANAGAGPGFDAITAEYPRRAAIEAARRQWDEIKPDGELQHAILRAVRAWKGSDEWQRERGRYVPKLARFLRDQRWLDAPGAAVHSRTTVLPVEPEVRLTTEQLQANKARATEVAALARRVLRQGAPAC